MALFGQIMALQARYVAGEISAVEFSESLAPHVADDFVFWCNYTPASDALQPLFADRYGVEGLLERYRIEQELERIEAGTTQPYDFAVGDDNIYLSLRETASFGGGPNVTFDMLIKTGFVGGKIARLEMFVDGRPIDDSYPAETD